ncbi:MAG: phosphate ABC transporter ATP-binding protein [Bosea sp. (in: a-proteobacteria)]
MMRDTASILPLTIEGLGFDAGGRKLLDDVSCIIQPRGITAILGANGAGKSLLLRLCHGLILPGSGAVRWHSGGGEAMGRKRHAMVFQKPVMLRRSARSNITHALNAAGHSHGKTVLRADEALARFGLSGLAGQPARLLSGGEQQRLAIARAWALAPELLFLDEPTSALDPGATRQIETMLMALRGEGVTMVMATHDLGQARRLADRVLFLDRGRLLEDAPAATFFHQPATQEARAFIQGDLPW